MQNNQDNDPRALGKPGTDNPGTQGRTEGSSQSGPPSAQPSPPVQAGSNKYAVITARITEAEKKMIAAATLSEASEKYDENEAAGIICVILNRVLEKHRGFNSVAGIILHTGIYGAENKTMEYQYGMGTIDWNSDAVKNRAKKEGSSPGTFDKLWGIRLGAIKAVMGRLLEGTFEDPTRSLISKDGSNRGAVYWASNDDWRDNKGQAVPKAKEVNARIIQYKGTRFFRLD